MPVSAGGEIGQLISSSNGSRCKTSEPTGPRSLLHHRSFSPEEWSFRDGLKGQARKP